MARRVVIDTSKYKQPKKQKPEAPKTLSAEKIKEYADDLEIRKELLQNVEYGHAEERHSGKDITQLPSRNAANMVHADHVNTQDLLKRFKDDRNLPYASVFYIPMDNLVQRALTVNAGALSDWYNKTKDPDIKIRLTAREMIGHGISASDRRDYDCRVALFSIKRLADGRGFGIETAYPDIERAMERDASKDQKIILNKEKNGDHANSSLCVLIPSEASAAKTKEEKFAVVASHFSHRDFPFPNPDKVRVYYKNVSQLLAIANCDNTLAIVLDKDFRVEGRVKRPGKDKFDTEKISVVLKMAPELEPFVNEMIKEKNRLKQVNMHNDITETISNAEHDGKIEYENVRHPISNLDELQDQAKIRLTIPDNMFSEDGYLIRLKIGDKIKSVFADKWTGDRTVLDPEELNHTYRIEAYDVKWLKEMDPEYDKTESGCENQEPVQEKQTEQEIDVPSSDKDVR